MARELPTVEIHSLKDPTQRWRINADDFDESIHRLWTPARSESVPEVKPNARVARTPSVPDFVLDESGETVAVNIIDPRRGMSRKQIPTAEYNPDVHNLWSTHSRFQR